MPRPLSAHAFSRAGFIPLRDTPPRRMKCLVPHFAMPMPEDDDIAAVTVFTTSCQHDIAISRLIHFAITLLAIGATFMMMHSL